MAALHKRDSGGSSHSGLSGSGTRESVRSSVRALERVLPWRRKNRVASFGEFEEQLPRGSVFSGSVADTLAEEEAMRRASSLTLGNQVGRGGAGAGAGRGARRVAGRLAGGGGVKGAPPSCSVWQAARLGRLCHAALSLAAASRSRKRVAHFAWPLPAPSHTATRAACFAPPRRQVLEALQSVGPSLRQAPIAEAMQDEGKRLSWMNKLMGNVYQLARRWAGRAGECTPLGLCSRDYSLPAVQQGPLLARLAATAAATLRPPPLLSTQHCSARRLALSPAVGAAHGAAHDSPRSVRRSPHTLPRRCSSEDEEDEEEEGGEGVEGNLQEEVFFNPLSAFRWAGLGLLPGHLEGVELWCVCGGVLP